MISSKFSSFKQSKQVKNFGQTQLTQINRSKPIDPPPRSFQEIANRNNRVLQETHENGAQGYTFGGVLKQQSISDKKFRSQLYTGQKQRQTQLNNKETTVIKLSTHKQAKENLNFKSILLQKRNTLRNQRPPMHEKKIQIAPPSFIKNATKSFIQSNQLDSSCGDGKKMENSFNENVRLLREYSQCQSMSMSDRNSLQDFQNISFNSSLKDLSDKDAMNLTGSTQLNKELEDINSKIKLILNNSLNFSRRASQTQKQSNKPSTSRQHEGLNNYHSMAELISRPNANSLNIKHGKGQADGLDISQSKNKKINIATINFSKKFQHYKKHSQGKPAIYAETQEQKQIQLEDFLLLAQIGTGKYGKVFRAIHKPTGFLCALKTISKNMIKQENIEIPTIRQIKIQLYLNHPNLVKLYGVFSDQETLYLVMEYCSSGTLLKQMKQRAYQQGQIVDILGNIFEAVSYMHCHGIIHRDLKPQNIVVQFNQYKLCDFGWAAYAGRDARTTFCGTPLYVSPQILKGQQHDTKTDVWGLGIVTYELVFGRVPFPICSESDMIKIVNDPVYFPNWTQVSQDLKKLIKRMLFKNPDDRCSLNELLNEQIFQLRAKKSLQKKIFKEISGKMNIL